MNPADEPQDASNPGNGTPRRRARASVAGARLLLGALVACVLPIAAVCQSLDKAHSRFGFEMRTRWGQVIDGRFPQYEGEVSVLEDGRRQVRIRLASDSVVVDDSPRYTRFARGERFLDARRHPWVEFVSDPYAGELVRNGGPLNGMLTMHGVRRKETFLLTPSDCDQPARECDVVGHGIVSRSNYGLDTWRWAVIDEVRFKLRVRLQEPAP